MRSLRSTQAGESMCRNGMQHRRNARRERARNVPHLQCKKRCSASAASITQAMDGAQVRGRNERRTLTGMCRSPHRTSTRCAEMRAVAVMQSQCRKGARNVGTIEGTSDCTECGVRNASVRSSVKCEAVQAQGIRPRDSGGFCRFQADSSSIYPRRPGISPCTLRSIRCTRCARKGAAQHRHDRKCKRTHAEKLNGKLNRKSCIETEKIFCICCNFLYTPIKKESCRRALRVFWSYLGGTVRVQAVYAVHAHAVQA